MISAMPLTREEQLILAAVGAGFLPQHHHAVLRALEEGIVWRGVQFLAERNNAGALLYRTLRNVPGELVPEQVQTRLRQTYLSVYQRNQEFARVIAALNEGFNGAGVEAVFLRGLVLAEHVYRNPSLRRFADVDVLVSRPTVARALAVIEGMGGVARPGTLANGYYYRNHFHIERVMGNGQGSTVELHWNLDHRYTLFTIDIPALIGRSVPVQLSTTCVRALDPVDDLLALCLHAVKHCPAIRHFPESPLLPRRILLDGWLTQVLDIAMALTRYGEVDWDRLVHTACAWGIEPAASGAFTAVHTILGVGPPPGVRQRFCTPARVLWLERRLVRAFVDPAITLQSPEKRGLFTRSIVRKWRFQEDAVFHPIRLLDLLGCYFPGREALARWFGRPRLRPYGWWWLRHTLDTTGRLIVGTCDLMASRIMCGLKRASSFRAVAHGRKAPGGAR